MASVPPARQGPVAIRPGLFYEWGILPIDYPAYIVHNDNMDESYYLFVGVMIIALVRIGLPLACLLLCGWLGDQLRKRQTATKSL